MKKADGNQENYMNAWPAWLSMEEINRIRDAARGDLEGSVVVAGCLYLGLSPVSAARIRTGRAYGDAVENRTNKAFLHIPIEYRRMIEREGITRRAGNDRLIDSTEEQAQQAINRVFCKAGIDTENAADRLRRTAARLHYYNHWTPKEQIERWFKNDLRKFCPGIRRAAFYRLILTDEEQQAIIDESLMRFSLVGKK